MTPDTTEKIAAFAPMPRAMVRTATAEKPGARREHARGEADILARVLEPRRDHRVERPLSVRMRIAEPRPRIAPRLVGGQALAALFLLDERDMRVQFLPKVVIHARPAHDIPEPAKW